MWTTTADNWPKCYFYSIFLGRGAAARRGRCQAEAGGQVINQATVLRGGRVKMWLKFRQWLTKYMHHVRGEWHMMCVLKHTAAKNSVHDTAKDAIMTRDFSPPPSLLQRHGRCWKSGIDNLNREFNTIKKINTINKTFIRIITFSFPILYPHVKRGAEQYQDIFRASDTSVRTL